MEKNNGFTKISLLAAAVIGVIAVALIVISFNYFSKTKTETANAPKLKNLSKMEEKTVEPVKQIVQADFIETGQLSNWDSVLESETDAWRLIYEKPGAPALIANLIFNENSKCDMGQGEKFCGEVELTMGSAKIEGKKDAREVGSANVTVLKLQKTSL